MRIHYLQHVPFEGPGAIELWATGHGHRLTCTRLFAGEALPNLDAVDWLLIMGGPMSVHDETAHDWLRPEKRFIASAISAEKIVLGICLGAQLIAEVLGANVYRNACPEIGWFPVARTPEASTTRVGAVLPEHFEAFHWHGETFDLPPGAAHLATSEACTRQAYAYRDRVLGLQFHLETTRTGAEQLITHCADEIVEAAFIQPAHVMLADHDRFARINDVLARVLDQLAAARTERT